MSLKSELTAVVAAAFEAAGYDPSYGAVVPAQRKEFGDFQCNGALPAKKQYDKPPRTIAQEVVDQLTPQSDIFSEVSLAGPGFINLRLAPAYIAGHMNRIRVDERLGVPEAERPLKIIVDYGGANIAKPLHVGHLRAAIIGESIYRTAKFLGHDTIGDVHLGDWGLQMGQIITELQERQPDLVYFDPDFSGDYPAESPVTIDDLEEIYPIASGKSKTDEEFRARAQQATAELQEGRPGYMALWQHFHNVSVADLKKNYGALEVFFDLWLGESDAQKYIPALIADLSERGIAEESDGALIVDVSLAEDKHDVAPLMLVKSNGAVGYGTTDLATIVQRMQDVDPDYVLYVVDGRQQFHFKQVFRAAYKAGIAVADKHQLEHNYFGTMNGKDGKPFKTREGGVLRLTDMLDMIYENALARLEELDSSASYTPAEKEDIARKVGLAALKFGDLVNHRTIDYIFDLDRFSSFEGRTGPYLLYANVRTRSILRKAEEQGLEPGGILPPASAAEQELMLKLLELPDLVAYAFETRAPNHLCEYAYTLSIAFNRFYQEHHILKEENAAQQASWLGMAQLTVQALEQVLELLGIPAPERM